VKISIEEVSRLIAVSQSERAHGQMAVVSFPLTSEIAFGRDATDAEVASKAQEVQQVKKLVNQLPEIREDRVQALKAQIENGTYHVSGEDIADLIIRRALADNTAL
jgi:negative regulator of flagellin synthesis FlgM